MAVHYFRTGARFRWKGVTWQVNRSLPGDKLNIEDIFTEEAMSIRRARLIQALFDDELIFDINQKGDGGIGVATPLLDFEDYPKELQAVANYRLEVIMPLVKLGPHERTDKDIRARVEELQSERDDSDEKRKLIKSLSVRSVYRWIKLYADSGGDKRSLIPKTCSRGGRGGSRLEPPVEIHTRQAIEDLYFKRERVTAEDIRDEVEARLDEEENSRLPEKHKLAAPAVSTIARRLNTIDPQRRFKSKHGHDAAEREFGQSGQMPLPQLPLERVEVDHTPVHLIVIDDDDLRPLGRMTLTYAYDGCTHYPLGYYLGWEPPSYYTVLECLFHTILPKPDTGKLYGTEHLWVAHGMPTTLVVDNAFEFIGDDLEDFCHCYGIELIQGPVGVPGFRGTIEGGFHSLNVGLFDKLPGATFADPRRRGDYDSLKRACILFSAVDRMMYTQIVDIYAQEVQKGMEVSPAQRWGEFLESGFSPRLPSSARDLRIRLGRVKERSIQRYGIEFETLRYNCPELGPLRHRLKKECGNTRVKIKVHPGNLSCIYVRNPFDENDYIEVPALAEEYADRLALWQHKILRRYVLDQQRKPNLANLGRAKRKVRQIAADGKKEKRLRTRQRVARYETGGRPSREVAEEIASGESDASTSEDVAPTVLLPPAGWEEDELLEEEQDVENWELDFVSG